MGTGVQGEGGKGPWPWLLVAVLVYAAIVLLNGDLPADKAFLWVRAGEYGLLGAILLGGISRLLPGSGPYVWRPLMIVIGAVLSGLEVFLRTQAFPQQAVRIDAWMTALIGLAVVAIVARVAPGRVRALWYGEE